MFRADKIKSLHPNSTFQGKILQKTTKSRHLMVNKGKSRCLILERKKIRRPDMTLFKELESLTTSIKMVQIKKEKAK